MNLIPLKTKELCGYHCGCHGNIVTIAYMYLADAYYPKKSCAKYELNTIKDKGVNEVSLWLPW